MTLQLIKNHKYIIIIILLFTFLISALAMINDVAVKQGDPIRYMMNALDIFHYESKYHPPLYSILMAFVNIFINDIFSAGKIISVSAGIVFILFTYLIGILCFENKRVALLGSLLAAISPLVINHSYLVGSDMLAAAFFLVSLYLFSLFIKKQKKTYIILSGIIAGLAYLSRCIFIGVLPAVLFYIFFIKHNKIKDRFMDVLYYSVPFLIVISPWSFICILKYGNLHSMNHINIAFEMLDTTNSWLWWSEYEKRYPTFLSLVVAHPKELIHYFLKNSFYFPLFIIIKNFYVAGFIFIAGILVALRKNTIERIPLIISNLFILILVLLVKLDPRLYLWIVPFILLYSAYIIFQYVESDLSDYFENKENVLTWLRKVPVRKLVIALTVLVAVMTSIIQVPKDFKINNTDDEKRAGEFIKRNTDRTVSVLSSSLNLAWYADRKYIPMTVLRDLKPEELEEKVSNTGADLFVYTKRHSIYTHPQLEFLLNPENVLVPDSWRLIYITEDEWPVVIYKT